MLTWITDNRQECKLIQWKLPTHRGSMWLGHTIRVQEPHIVALHGQIYRQSLLFVLAEWQWKVSLDDDGYDGDSSDRLVPLIR